MPFRGVILRRNTFICRAINSVIFLLKDLLLVLTKRTGNTRLQKTTLVNIVSSKGSTLAGKNLLCLGADSFLLG